MCYVCSPQVFSDAFYWLGQQGQAPPLVLGVRLLLLLREVSIELRKPFVEGFAVLGVNFRGSTGFGHAFTRAISAQGGVGWNVGGEDTIACVRHALEQHGSWIDADKVVGLGASYGGFTIDYDNLPSKGL